MHVHVLVQVDDDGFCYIIIVSSCYNAHYDVFWVGKFRKHEVGHEMY